MVADFPAPPGRRFLPDQRRGWTSIPDVTHVLLISSSWVPGNFLLLTRSCGPRGICDLPQAVVSESRCLTPSDPDDGIDMTGAAFGPAPGASVVVRVGFSGPRGPGPRFRVLCPWRRSSGWERRGGTERSSLRARARDILSDLELGTVPCKGLISTSVTRADYVY